jgi:hypothetical protein
MKPEKKAFVLLDMTFWMGTHGLSKVDWTTEWFWQLLDNMSWTAMAVQVYLWVELELNHVSSVGLDIVGEESQ